MAGFLGQDGDPSGQERSDIVNLTVGAMPARLYRLPDREDVKVLTRRSINTAGRIGVGTLLERLVFACACHGLSIFSRSDREASKSNGISIILRTE